MSKTVAFLSETPGSATIHDQQSCLSAEDLPVLAGRKTLNQLAGLLAREGIRLEAGDRVKIHDLSCLPIATPMLIRAIAKLLKRGISVEIWAPGIVVNPDGDDKLHSMFDALDAHYRHLHGIKTHPPAMAQPGRKRLLDPEKLPEIRAKLSQPGATTSDVALSLGVARSTLFNYLERYDVERRVGRGKKEENCGSEDSGDDVEVPSHDPHGSGG